MRSRFDGLCEFISRRGRMKILSLFLNELGSVAEVAKELEVTRTAVYGWREDERRHPSNEHTRKMVDILTKKKENEVKNILLEELSIFGELIFSRFSVLDQSVDNRGVGNDFRSFSFGL